MRGFNKTFLLIAIFWMFFLPATAAASLDSGAQWLAGQQHESGAILSEETTATSLQSTAESLLTLTLLERTGAVDLQSALEYIGNNPDYETVENLCRRILVHSSGGLAFDDLLDRLSLHQYPGAGYGFYPGYGSDVLSTAHALHVLSRAEITDQRASSAIGFLLHTQKEDGSWSLQDNTSNTALTAQAMLALWEYRRIFNVQDALEMAGDYLLQKRNADHLWDDLNTTSHVLIALSSYLVDRSGLADSIAALQDLQSPQGDFNQDTYSTALAVRALSIAEAPAPDEITMGGTLIDGDSGIPIAGATIAMTGEAELSATSSIDGTFLIRAIPPGSYSVIISKDGYNSLSLTASLPVGSEVDLGVVHLYRSSSAGVALYGVVSDGRSGDPLPGATVQINTSHGMTMSTTTGADGSYGLMGIPAGEITVTVTHVGYHSASITLTAAAGSYIPYSPVLEPVDDPEPTEGSLTGTVIDAESGSGLGGVSVTVAYPDGDLFHSTTGPDGVFYMDDLPIGDASVHFDREGYHSETTQFTVQAGHVSNVGQISLQPELEEVDALAFGHLIDEQTGSPVSGGVIRAIQLTGDDHGETISANDGYFVLEGLSPGQYQVSVEAEGYEAVEFAMTVGADEELDLGDILLQPVEELLPDLAITALDITDRVSDPATFALSGAVGVTIVNLGEAAVTEPFAIYAYEDLAGEGVPEEDAILGSIVVQASPEDPLDVGDSRTIVLPLAGVQSFRDAPITVHIDPDGVLDERCTNNNRADTAGICAIELEKPHIDLSLCMDGSGSISHADFQLQLEGTARAIEDESIIPRDGSVRLSAIQFNANSFLELGPTIIDEGNVQQVADAIRSIQRRGGGTAIDSCINMAADLLYETEPASAWKVIDVSTDGISNFNLAVAASERARDMGIDVINAIGVGSGIDMDLLNAIVFPQPAGGERGFVTTIGDYQDYGEAIAYKMQRETLLPDLTVGGTRLAGENDDPADSVSFIIGNAGASSISEDIIMSIYDGDPDQGGRLLAEETFSEGLVTGAYTEIIVEGVLSTDVLTGTLVVSVRIDGDFNECNQENNRHAIPVHFIQGSIDLVLDRTLVGPEEALGITVSVTNSGLDPQVFQVELRILDHHGSEVHRFDSFDSGELDPHESGDHTRQWERGDTLPALYTARAELYSLDGTHLDTSEAAFVVSHMESDPEPGDPAARISAASDRAEYQSDDTVTIDILVQNITTTTTIDNPVVHLTVTDPDGSVLYDQTGSLESLAPGQVMEFQQSLGLVQAAAGLYHFSAELADQEGTVYDRSQGSFTVEAGQHWEVSGTVGVEQTVLMQGENQTCTYTVTNSGAVPIQNLPISISVIDLADESVLERSVADIDLPVGETLTHIKSFSTADFSPGAYAAVLQAEIDGHMQDIAYALFHVDESPVDIDGDIAVGDQGRVLVLLDPADSPGSGESDQRAYLHHLLEEAGWLATIVDTEADFETELLSGGYSLFVLLNRSSGLSDTVQEILSERVSGGDGLLVAGGHHGSGVLAETLGIAVTGSSGGAKRVVLEASDLGEGWSQDLAHPSRASSFETLGATVIAGYECNHSGSAGDGETSLGAAEDFNAFVFEHFSSVSSAVEGRLAVGGNLSLNHYGVGNRLKRDQLSDVIVVGGDVQFPSGRIYNGNLVAGGSIAGVGDPVLFGLSSGATAEGNATVPIDFEQTRLNLAAISAEIATLPTTGSLAMHYGGLSFTGDGVSEIQVFFVDAVELMHAHTFMVNGIPSEATVIFNVTGPHGGMSNMGFAGLSAMRERVLFNFPDAQQLDLTWIGIEGSILAPHADINNPRGNINGQVIAKSWDGPMAINHRPFKGTLPGGDECVPGNAVSIHQYDAGQTIFIGFDLIAEALACFENDPDAADNPFADLLKSTLEFINPDPLVTSAGRVIPIEVVIHNLGIATSGKAILSFEGTLDVVDAGEFTRCTSDDGDRWAYDFALFESQSEQVMIYVRLPGTAGGTALVNLLLRAGHHPDSVTEVEKQYSMPVY